MENSKAESYKEWFFQSNYDLETANSMFETGRYIYCVFMCHLSLEKCLKGLIIKQKNVYPPKTHNLVYLIELLELELSEEDSRFLFSLNKISVPTRYPENLSQLIDEYNKAKTTDILSSSKRIQEWIIKS